MRRFGRILSLVPAATSGVLCVVAAGLWVRGYVARDHATRRVAGMERVVVSSRGGFGCAAVVDVPASAAAAGPPAAWALDGQDPVDLLDFPRARYPVCPEPVAGFFFHWQVAAGRRETMLILPAWAVAAALALLPLSAAASTFRRRRRGRWLSAGLCPGCRYDCRATPGRCPECGLGNPAAKAGGG